MTSRLILILLLLLSYPFSGAIAAIDKEVAESLKCSRMFPYFERRFQIPQDTLHSIALKESGKAHSQHKIRVVWPWAVNVEGESRYFTSKREAINFAKQQLRAGKESIDVGCMQINLKHHPDAFKSLEQAFDPKSNVAYGAQFLRTKYEALGNWHKAIAHYHSATHELGFKYKQDVIKIALGMDDYKGNLKKCALSSQGRNAVISAKAGTYTKEQHKPLFVMNSRTSRGNDKGMSAQALPRKNPAPKNLTIATNGRLSSKYYPNRIRSNMMVTVPKSTRAQKL